MTSTSIRADRAPIVSAFALERLPPHLVEHAWKYNVNKEEEFVLASRARTRNAFGDVSSRPRASGAAIAEAFKAHDMVGLMLAAEKSPCGSDPTGVNSIGCIGSEHGGGGDASGDAFATLAASTGVTPRPGRPPATSSCKLQHSAASGFVAASVRSRSGCSSRASTQRSRLTVAAGSCLSARPASRLSSSAISQELEYEKRNREAAEKEVARLKVELAKRGELCTPRSAMFPYGA
eukprot:TRINITY_DN62668_c0_g1_i1.p1 TRINITY_DN62668_c0_g1~~TRINITY_DN62668_c0_g1_i1.p1  ORF type:complete len:235 (-),score=28.54 TRINITY_DN62668_c0_g1_i1:162-866(-)